MLRRTFIKLAAVAASGGKLSGDESHDGGIETDVSVDADAPRITVEVTNGTPRAVDVTVSVDAGEMFDGDIPVGVVRPGETSGGGVGWSDGDFEEPCVVSVSVRSTPA